MADEKKSGISWIASYPKSGNTWLRMFLAIYNNGGNPVRPNALPREFEAADHQDEHYHCVSPCPVARLTETEVLYLRGAVLIKILTDSRTRPLWVKTHHARLVVDDIRLIPDLLTGPSVYIVRDPRDVAISFAKWTGIDIDQAIMMMAEKTTIMRNPTAKNIFHYVGNWSTHVESWYAPDTLMIRYEDMHLDSLATFRKVLVHAGIEVDEDRIRRSIDNAAFPVMAAAEREERFFELPPGIDVFFRAGTFGHWREELTKTQARTIEKDHHDMMTRLGYLDA